MNSFLKTIVFILLIPCTLQAQNIGIGTTSPDSSAKLDISGTDGGILIPRMSGVQRDSIESPATGLLIFQIDGASGFYFYDGTAWTLLSGGSSSISGLEEITEAGNTGYRISGRDPAYFGNIGSEAIDLSYSSSPSTSAGASGIHSFASGMDATASGSYSTAMGSNTIASGENSVSIGKGSEAKGLESYAFGYYAKADSINSFAYGEYAEAKGWDSYAFGEDATADSMDSYAFGEDAIANGYQVYAFGKDARALGSNNYAFGEDAESDSIDSYAFGESAEAIGVDNYAIGESAEAIGTENYAIGELAEAIGEDNYAFGELTEAIGTENYAIGELAEAIGEDNYAFGELAEAIGEDNYAFGELAEADSIDSYAFGELANASGVDVYAFGELVNASGIDVYAFGELANASGEDTYAFGELANASGEDTYAFGELANASGQNSYALGRSALTTGDSSMALGQVVHAAGDNSTAIGNNTIALSYAETAIGSYNTTYNPNDTLTWNAADRLFVIGNGQSSSRSDAMIVYKSGNTTLNGALTLSNGSDSITLPNIDGTTGQILATDGAGNVSWVNASTGTDDQNISGSQLNGTTLTIGIEGGSSETIDLASLKDGTGALEEITEAGNTGHRIAGRDTANYGDIGNNSVDLSYSQFASTTNGATGNNSTAMGGYTEASGYSSTAMGELTEASGQVSTAMGVNTDASGAFSTAMGSQTDASGFVSTAIGDNTTASGDASTSMGIGTQASGYNSTAMGSYTTASSTYSTAMGQNTISSGIASTTMGGETEASATYSTAMGYQTKATGNLSIAAGWNTESTGTYTTALGSQTIAAGMSSTSIGDNTIALSYAETALGSYNTTYNPNDTLTWNAADRLFVIGNGQSLSRSDAMIVYKSGLAEFSNDVNVGGNIDITGNTDMFGDVIMYDNTTVLGNLGLGNTELRLRGNGDPNHYLKYFTDGAGFDGPKLYGYGTIALQTNNMEVVLRNGRMGVGTNSPTKGKLHVSGSDSYSAAGGGWFANNGGGTGTYGAYNFNVGIYCENDLIVSGFIATESDARLKNISGVSDASSDLETLMSIEVTDYTLKDVIGQGGRDFKKVIAQQVEGVFPQAVNTTSNYIPNIYEAAKITNGKIMVSAEVTVGDKIKMFKEDGSELHVNVLATDANSFTVDSDYEGQVFIYGKEVDDFRGVDYDALSMLNISATQELHRLIQDLQLENAELKNVNASFQNQLDEIKVMLNTRESNTAIK